MKRWLLPAVLYIAITIVMMYPLLPHIGSTFPHDLGDPAPPRLCNVDDEVDGLMGIRWVTSRIRLSNRLRPSARC